MGIETALLGANVAGGIAGGKAIGKAVGGKGAPPPPDYLGAVREQGRISQDLVNQQTRANRPDQSTPFASSTWDVGPNGEYSQQVRLNGPLADASMAAQQQFADAIGKGLDLSSLQELGSGDAARQQAIDAAYSQATSRLDPRFSQARDRERTRLLNQGLAEGSEAFNKSLGELGNQENDAYNQALYSAIGQGTGAGQAIFNQNLAARQQGLAELLQQRNAPIQALQQLQGLTAQPGFQGAGVAQTPDLLGATGQQDQANLQRYQLQQQQFRDLINSISQLGVAGAQIASDERLKQNIQRSSFEVLPGVPLASWEWRPEYGVDGPTVGVVAQDLQQVLPEAVSEGPDGYLMVDYGALKDFLP